MGVVSLGIHHIAKKYFPVSSIKPFVRFFWRLLCWPTRMVDVCYMRANDYEWTNILRVCVLGCSFYHAIFLDNKCRHCSACSTQTPCFGAPDRTPPVDIIKKIRKETNKNTWVTLVGRLNCDLKHTFFTSCVFCQSFWSFYLFSSFFDTIWLEGPLVIPNKPNWVKSWRHVKSLRIHISHRAPKVSMPLWNV